MNKFLLILSLCFTASVMANEPLDAGKAWLNIIDKANYTKSWQEADPLFKEQLAKQKWDEALKGVRTPLGKVNSREVLTHKEYDSLPNMPKGDYIVIQYKTSFSNKKEAVETVTLSKSSGQWRAVGYFIQ
ncbi:DUF4019 domain-containing protein [Thalassotalea sp. 1_MG-2023]|uniref:DUF4019 domain-containing protein n=1 Tax=Thalassotalea sp. 1_MG-2023 TaxID=3062680 RepID=UPI0026E3FE87|nr:DUF4019 domain-containing protein [Thalassotalea sp. 1_MG-2023]MDO6426969.1 DUF4019 domain-containing protein [Thalassotalea sp. 1_MG-2023]